MNHTSNNVGNMLHMRTDAMASPDCSRISRYHQHKPSGAVVESDPLCLLMRDIALNGEEVLEIAEDTLENLQEQFLVHIRERLAERGVRLQEKLNIGLSPANTLVIQYADADDEILAALGEDEQVVRLFTQLQRYAFIVSGLRLLRAGGQAEATPGVPQRYNMCLKGVLSHFYLK